jgi:hypothetical protein
VPGSDAVIIQLRLQLRTLSVLVRQLPTGPFEITVLAGCPLLTLLGRPKLERGSIANETSLQIHERPDTPRHDARVLLEERH